MIKYINTAYVNRKKEHLNDIFLRNCWLAVLNVELCMRKLSHSDENAQVFFAKRETLRFLVEL